MTDTQKLPHDIQDAIGDVLETVWGDLDIRSPFTLNVHDDGCEVCWKDSDGYEHFANFSQEGWSWEIE